MKKQKKYISTKLGVAPLRFGNMSWIEKLVESMSQDELPKFTFNERDGCADCGRFANLTHIFPMMKHDLKSAEIKGGDIEALIAENLFTILSLNLNLGFTYFSLNANFTLPQFLTISNTKYQIFTIISATHPNGNHLLITFFTEINSSNIKTSRMDT
jgi:hypothetical protein